MKKPTKINEAPIRLVKLSMTPKLTRAERAEFQSLSAKVTVPDYKEALLNILGEG